jgi:predicted nucleotidyltransferase
MLVTEELIDEMARAVVAEVAPQAIILFGSHALGKSHPGSDIDLMIVESAPFGRHRDRRQELARLWRVLSRFAVPKDILVYSREEVERWRHARNHVIARALREGRFVYGAL